MSTPSEAQTPQPTFPRPPYACVYDGSSDWSIGPVGDPQGLAVCTVHNRNDDRARAICQFLVRAVNSHDQMLAALKVAWEFMASDRADCYYNPPDEDLLTVLTAIENADRDEQGRPRSGRFTVEDGRPQFPPPIGYETTAKDVSAALGKLAAPTPTAQCSGGPIFPTLAEQLATSAMLPAMLPEVADALDRLVDAYKEYTDHGPTLGNAIRAAMAASVPSTPWTLTSFVGDSPTGCWSAVYDAQRGLVLYESCNDHELAKIIATHDRIVACVNACAGIRTADLIEHGSVSLNPKGT